MNEVKQVVRRMMALFLVLAMILPFFPQMSMKVQAAVSGTLTGLANEDIGASYEGTDNGSYSNWSVTGGNSIKGSVISVSGTCSTTSYNTTLTLTNNKSTEAVLSFDYAVEQNSGTIQVAGADVSADGSYSGTIAAGDSIKIYLASGSTSNAASITMTNLSLLADAEPTVTFRPAEHGSYTVGGGEVTEETSKTQHSSIAYNLAATPDEGYKFCGWYSVTEGKYLSADTETSLYLDADQTITAVFVSGDAPVFSVGAARFTDLNEADAYAVSNGIEKISLVSDGILPAGDYTISEGVILLIPFDDGNTCYTTAPATTGSSYSTPSCYRKLVMESGANMTVNGELSVSAKHTANGNGFNGAPGGGAPTGGYGYIFMEDGSSITVNQGGGLYVYGYISGNGTVTAESGAVVYENMQIKDFRGGSVTSAMAGNEQKVFPLNQYFVQNIEAELTLESGADEFIYTSLYASSMSTSTAVHFIGEGGMFELEEGGTFSKKYLPAEDILEVNIIGDASVNSLTLKVLTITVSSADYVLPITNGMRLNVLSGTTNITQDVALLAGVKVHVSENAALHVGSGSSLYVYDRDEWIANNYASSSTFKTVTYSPTRTYTRKQTDLTDVQMDINGTLLADGYIYTTESGADIISSNGTGRLIMNNGAGTDTVTYQAYGAENLAYAEIPVTSAKLHNGSIYAGTEDEYTSTSGAVAGSVYTYDTSADKWKKKGETEQTYTVTFDANGGEGEMEDQVFVPGEEQTLNENIFSRENYLFTGWNTKADGTGTDYADGGAIIDLTEDMTLYAQWRILNGIYLDEETGNYYYCIDGIIMAIGLIEIDGSYYYARTSTGALVTNQSYWITKTNGLLEAGIYQFDETGKIVFPDEEKNGIVEENGSLYYYVDGELTGAGLIQIGDDYYYVRTSTGEVVHGRTYWITATNGLPLPSAQYEFAEDGRLIQN